MDKRSRFQTLVDMSTNKSPLCDLCLEGDKLGMIEWEFRQGLPDRYS